MKFERFACKIIFSSAPNIYLDTLARGLDSKDYQEFHMPSPIDLLDSS